MYIIPAALCCTTRANGVDTSRDCSGSSRHGAQLQCGTQCGHGSLLSRRGTETHTNTVSTMPTWDTSGRVVPGDVCGFHSWRVVGAWQHVVHMQWSPTLRSMVCLRMCTISRTSAWCGSGWIPCTRCPVVGFAVQFGFQTVRAVSVHTTCFIGLWQHVVPMGCCPTCTWTACLLVHGTCGCCRSAWSGHRPPLTTETTLMSLGYHQTATFIDILTGVSAQR